MDFHTHILRAALRAALLAIPFGLFAALAVAAGRPQASRPTGRLFITPHAAPININNVSVWASDNGHLEQQPETFLGGVTYPKGTLTTIYSGGLVWTGSVHDGGAPALRYGGQVYRTGTVPGRILAKGQAQDPWDPDVHVYRIRRDWKTADLKKDAAEVLNVSTFDVTPSDIADLRHRYAEDWMTWPAAYGAPYYERNGIPGYQPDTSGAPNADEPGLANADQVVWTVCNDLDSSQAGNFGGTIGAGLEWQITCWAFASRPGLENVVFERYRVIYKGTKKATSTSSIESMYMGKWADPDIGDFNDDFAGYDQSRSMVYAYNSSDIDAEYGKLNMIPPAIGFSLLQGPITGAPGSSAHFDLQNRPGYRNLGPASAIILANSFLEDSGSIPPARSWNNLLQGFRPRPVTGAPQCFREPFSGGCTKFLLSGDPIAQTGWNDGWTDKAGDRRMLISTGPFRMVLGDTQEVVIALAGGQGDSRFGAIAALREHADVARDNFNRNFVMPAAIPVPPLRIVSLDKTFILDWESDTAITRSVEQYRSFGYSFYTYKVRQFADSLPGSRSVEFPPFDPFKPRSMYVTQDLLRNRPLVNGQHYFYAVSAVMYNPDTTVAEHYRESPLTILEAVPHMPDPGVVYPYSIGDTIRNIVNSVGMNDAPVKITFFDPTKTIASPYKILFHRPTLLERPVWDLIETGTNDTLIRRRPVESDPVRVHTRGLMAYVGTPHFGIKDLTMSLYKGEPSTAPVFNYPSPGHEVMLVGEGTSQLDTISGATSSDLDIEWRFTGDSSWAVFMNRSSGAASKWVRVPYTVWQINRTGTGARQLYTYITSPVPDSIWRPRVLLDRSYEGKTLKVFYPVTVYADSQYSSSPHPGIYGAVYYDDIPFRAESSVIKNILWVQSIQAYPPKTSINKVYVADLDEDGIPAPPGTIFRFTKYKEIHDLDEKIFLAQGVQAGNPSAMQQALSMINVFPNPYYGVNTSERSRLQKYVTFSHLPDEATIRIFNSAGILVRTLHKQGGGQFQEWDLNNENGLPVASGVFIAHLELRDRDGSDLGTTVLKLMIVQEDHFYQTR